MSLFYDEFRAELHKQLSWHNRRGRLPWHGRGNILQSHRMAEAGRGIWRSPGPSPCLSRANWS